MSKIQSKTAFVVHTFTSLGVICAFFSIRALFEGDARESMLWLLASLVIDGADGPISRKIGIKDSPSRLDGDVLDLVVDFLTFILIPALFMWKFDLFPESISTVMTLALLVVGALYSARLDMKTEDKWFNGFPGSWNFLAVSLWLVETNVWVNTIFMVVFMVLTGTNVKFFHIFRSTQFRSTTVPLTALYFVAIVAMISIDGQLHNLFGKLIICTWFAYYLAVAYWKTWIEPKNLGSVHPADLGTHH